jgi:GNAT superfamily N-acetyltransferase
MNTFTVSPATESDVTEIIAMIRELAEFEHLAQEVEITADSLRAGLFGDRAVAAAVLARVGDTTAGYAIYYRTFSTFVGRPGIFLEDIYVRPAFRKGGIGRAMLEAVAQRSIDLGGGRFEWTALRWNENALRFYRGLGAKVMDDWAPLRMSGGDVRELLGGQRNRANLTGPA